MGAATAAAGTAAARAAESTAAEATVAAMAVARVVAAMAAVATAAARVEVVRAEARMVVLEVGPRVAVRGALKAAKRVASSEEWREVAWEAEKEAETADNSVSSTAGDPLAGVEDVERAEEVVPDSEEENWEAVSVLERVLESSRAPSLR